MADFQGLYLVSSNGCWLWTGPIGGNGYARFKGRDAHRLSYEMHRGPIAPNMAVCHQCDNPLCVNPAQLWLGTIRENALDMVAKGRAKNQFGGQSATHCINGHEYTPENTYWRPGNVAARDCRSCICARVRRYKQRKAA